MKNHFLFILLLCAPLAFAQNFPEMVKVEGGSFQMGDELGKGRPNERPIHTVTLKTFTIAKTETTVLQWKTYCNATGRKMPKAPSWGWIDSHPIIEVNWEDTVAYCEWLFDITGKTYRLPTEAEWEYAARGGKHSKGFKYSGGQSIDNTGWYKENSGTSTKPVAQKRPNELSLYDMSGNVWEWCQDWDGPYSSKSQNNPIGPKTGTYNILRGGGWYYPANSCRVADRYKFTPELGNDNFGFRVVCEE